MAALSDTPTPPIQNLTSQAGVSIKLEQGVLYENEYGSVNHKIVRQGNPNIEYDSNQTPTTLEKGSYTIANRNNHLFNTTDKIYQPSIEIKCEPPVDIDDTYVDEERSESTDFNSELHQSPAALSPRGSISPQIRLTPTSKLIASPNTSVAEGTPNKRRYVCLYENCTKSYGKSSHLRSHLTWHTGIKPFVCKESGCGKGFTRSDELNRHIRTHTGEKPFECVQCTKKFSRSDHLTKHLATHSKQMAASNGAHSKRVKLDKTSSPSVTIPKVDQSAAAATPVLITSPMDNEENNSSYSDSSHFMAGFVQNIQARNYETPENLTNNDEEESIREPIKIKLEKPGDSDDYQVVPQQRETITASPTDVMMPIIKMEPEVSIKHEPIEELTVEPHVTYEDDPDDDAIMPEANLPPLSSTVAPAVVKNHPFLTPPFNPIADTVYDPSRPFPCSQCTKCFKRQDDLNRHMRTHTGEKPFACNECEKRFMRSDHLKKHMNTHTRVR